MSSIFLECHEDKIYEQVFKEFGKTRIQIDEDINTLKNWAVSQPHFPEKPNYYLLRCMIACNKFSIEKAKQKLDLYYTIRTILPELFYSHPLTPEMALERRVVYLVPLPKTTSDLKRVIYHQINSKYDSKHFNHLRVTQNLCNLIELLIQEDSCSQFEYVFNCAGVKMGHLQQFNPMIIKKSFVIVEKVFPNRLSTIYVVNCDSAVQTILNNVIKPLLSEKIRHRVKIYTDIKPLFEVFGKYMMPSDVGGNEKSLEELTDEVEKAFEKHRNRFEVLQTLKVNESLRPKKLINDDILGYYGSFKKIEVD